MTIQQFRSFKARQTQVIRLPSGVLAMKGQGNHLETMDAKANPPPLPTITEERTKKTSNYDITALLKMKTKASTSET